MSCLLNNKYAKGLSILYFVILANTLFIYTFFCFSKSFNFKLSSFLTEWYLFLFPPAGFLLMLFPKRHFFLCWNSWLGTWIVIGEHLQIREDDVILGRIWKVYLGIGTSLHSFHVICLQSVLVTDLQLEVLLTSQVKVLADLVNILYFQSSFLLQFYLTVARGRGS